MTVVERTRSFARETAIEIKKVSWPTRKELIDSTTLVIISVSVLMVLTFLFDRAFSAIVELILG